MAIAEPAATPLLAPGELRHVPLDQLREHPRNIRASLGDLADLVASIREKGVLIPLVVTTTGLVICGHRRLAAAREAGTETVPCIGAVMNEAQIVESMLIENLQRAAITPLEEAQAYQQLLDLGESAEDIARNVQTREARIRERTALLQLPHGARKALEDGGITIGAAEQLLKLREHPELIDKIVKRQVSSSYAKKPIANFYDVETELNRLHREAARAKARERAKKQGLKVVKEPGYNPSDGEPRRIGAGYHELNVEAKAHAKQPCHAVAISDGGKLVPVCKDPAKHAGEVVSQRDGTSLGRAAHEAREVQVGDADEARWEFTAQLFARAPSLFVDLSPMLAILALASTDQSEVNRLLGLGESARWNFGENRKKFATYLAADCNVVDGLPSIERDRLEHAAAAVLLVELRERLLEVEDDDPFLIYLIRILQRQGYAPNEAELKLLETAPQTVAGWFA